MMFNWDLAIFPLRGGVRFVDQGLPLFREAATGSGDPSGRCLCMALHRLSTALKAVATEKVPYGVNLTHECLSAICR
jgi:hypothetical protein